MSYSNEAAAKFFIQRTFSVWRDIRRISSETTHPETSLVLAYHCALYAAKALLYSLNSPADEDTSILLKTIDATEKGEVTEEMFSVLYEITQVYNRAHLCDLTPLRTVEADAVVQNLRTFIRYVREKLEQKYGLIEGI